MVARASCGMHPGEESRSQGEAKGTTTGVADQRGQTRTGWWQREWKGWKREPRWTEGHTCVLSASQGCSPGEQGQPLRCRHSIQLPGRLTSYSSGNAGPGLCQGCPGGLFDMPHLAHRRTGPVCESPYHWKVIHPSIHSFIHSVMCAKRTRLGVWQNRYQEESSTVYP